MNRYLRTAAGIVAILAGLALGRGAWARPAAQTTNPVDVVKAFGGAVNSHDEARLRQLLAPGFTDLEDPGWPDAAVVSRDDFIHEVIDQQIAVTFTQVRQTAAQTVVADDTLTFNAPGAPQPAHLFAETSTMTVVDGRITRLAEILTAQTRQDMAALAASAPAPGMPATGTPRPVPAAWAVLALLALVAGWRLRRAARVAG